MDGFGRLLELSQVDFSFNFDEGLRAPLVGSPMVEAGFPGLHRGRRVSIAGGKVAVKGF